MSQYARSVIALSSVRYVDDGIKRSVEQLAEDSVLELPDGTGTGQANRAWTVSGTLAAGAAVTYNLLSLTDSFGQALVFSKITCAMVRHRVGDLIITITGNTTPLPSGLGIYSGETLVRHRSVGYTVSVGSETLTLNCASGSGSVQYTVALIGST
jgi:hypothetical protein